MLTIRNAQLHILGRRSREQFVEEMLRHLYRYFSAVAWLCTPDELRHQVNATIDRAAVYQLTSRQQVCRFLNLSATYGWKFDSDPELLWMRNILTDTSLTRPQERLDRLVQTCLHRQAIEAHNLALRRQLGLAPVSAQSAPEPEPDDDYPSLIRDVNADSPLAGSEEIIARNPLSYRRSQSLEHSLEAIPTMRSSQPPTAWINNAPPLILKKTGERNAVEK